MNKGKKYIKLRGDEVPTPANEKRARDFMEWYAANMDKLKYYAQGAGYPIDDDLFSDTMLRIYDAIALKGVQVNDYTGYFLQSYRSVFINNEKKKASGPYLTVPLLLEKPAELDTPAPDFDSREYEEAVETINAEVLEYVRGTYDEVSISLFEMYVGLAPDISYKKLSTMLGIPFVKVWSSIGNVKKSVVREFGNRKDFLLSVVNF